MSVKFSICLCDINPTNDNSAMLGAVSQAGIENFLTVTFSLVPHQKEDLPVTASLYAHFERDADGDEDDLRNAILNSTPTRCLTESEMAEDKNPD